MSRTNPLQTQIHLGYVLVTSGIASFLLSSTSAILQDHRTWRKRRDDLEDAVPLFADATSAPQIKHRDLTSKYIIYSF